MSQYARYVATPAASTMPASTMQPSAGPPEKLGQWKPSTRARPRPVQKRNVSMVNLLARLVAFAVLGIAAIGLLETFM